MNFMSGLVQLQARRNRMKAYQQSKTQFLALSELDLADMGIKRYQLDHAARKAALK
jgi:uncharacterized protein YjiS (DUF1127 family)